MVEKKYKICGHAKTSLRYHIIFSTKFRKRCLTDIRESVLESFILAEENSHFKILYMEIDKDHIHFLITFKPFLSISQVVRRLKQFSTKRLWETESEHLKKFFWKDKKILWTHGYFCSTIGEVSEETLRKYIKNQGK